MRSGGRRKKRPSLRRDNSKEKNLPGGGKKDSFVRWQSPVKLRGAQPKVGAIRGDREQEEENFDRIEEGSLINCSLRRRKSSFN